MLSVGDKAPKFKLNDQAGNIVQLSDFKGKKLVIYFYPKDQTPGCIKEACSFRDNIDAFKKHDIAVLGVSIDSEKSHQNFISKQTLNFPLLADVEKKMVTSYEVWGEKSMYGRKYMGTFRKTFLINEKGIIDKIYDKVKVATHAEDVLKDWEIK
ncbi:MAG: thioredoxin-dependent thiol peroxidase [Candidatus Marinimicrobia bacterium]|nr:thioredoxin-dependent thiol peroxidase [Candidatus Neomarinimicrobiota bacterium]MCF7921938.1 thioredoxin-dependent thiol peroxidase [Candidatus Neomarinimicrobiota bacterium]